MNKYLVDVPSQYSTNLSSPSACEGMRGRRQEEEEEQEVVAVVGEDIN